MATATENKITSKELACLAHNLNNLMSDKDIDTKQLSVLTGVSISLLNALKRGDGNPTLSTLIALANFFDVSIDSLILSDARKRGTVAIIPVYDMQVAHEINKHIAIKNIYLKIEEDKNISHYAIQLDNSSLMPFFDKGSIFLISTYHQYADGDIVLVRINNEFDVFRKVFIKNKGMLFQHISLDADLHSYDDYKIIGFVLRVIHNLRISND